jgi:selenocysteine lyase/cysteine desulfurase
VDRVTIGPSTTQNLNTLAHACAPLLSAGDEIVVSQQEHEANRGCWVRLCEQQGATLRVWPVDPVTGELALAELDTLLNPRTRLVAVTHSSNIIGTVNPLAKIAERVHAAGALLVADGVSYAPHRWPDIDATGADVYAFSLYKTFATHLGAMVCKPELLERIAPQCHDFNAKRLWSRLDAAGPDHASIAALSGLAEYFDALYAHHFGEFGDKSLAERVQAVSYEAHRHEAMQCAPLVDFLSRKRVRLLGKSHMGGREANLSLIPLAGTAADVAKGLAERQIAVKNSHFYAVRLLQAVGVENIEDGVLRISFAHYNTAEEVARLIAALDDLLPNN